MDLYVSLQTLLSKINEGATEARYAKDEKEILRIILENQSRLGEAVLILGGLLKAILADEIEIQVMAGKDDTKH